MNILLLVKNFDLGGTEVHVRELANQLFSLGHQIHIVSNTGRQVKLLTKGITHHPWPFSEHKTPLRIYQLSRLIRKHQINIIHAHQRIAITHAAILGKLTNTTAIATVHGRLSHDIRSKFIRKMLDHIIAVAPNRLSSLSKNSPILAKSSVIYNAVQPNSPSPASNRKPIISYVGRMDRKHTSVIRDLITESMPQVIGQFPETELHVVGDGPYLKRLIHLYDEIPSGKTKPKVIFHGYHPTPSEILAKSILNLGVGRVAIEALTVNTPVISVNSEHCGGLITLSNYQKLKQTNFVARAFEKYSSKTLTQQLVEFMQNTPPLNLTLHDQVRNEFSFKTMTSHMVELYQKYG